MYHHIANLRSDVWDITVSPTNFEQQLIILKEKGSVISLDKMVSLLKDNKLTHDCIAITFDDGYLDNLTTAVPLLKKYNLPATFFITSEPEADASFFWWDELEYIILFGDNLPTHFKMIIADKLIEVDLENEKELSQPLKKAHEKWNACEEVSPTKRAELFYRVWETLRPLSTIDQAKYLKEIKTWANIIIPEDFPYRIMSSNQVADLAKEELCSVGGHTQTHIALGYHNYDIQKKEIEGNQYDLKKVTGKKIDMLAYPYGNYNNTTQVISGECGFEAAFTTEPQPVITLKEPFRLGRFKVENINGKQFKRKLNEWLTL